MSSSAPDMTAGHWLTAAEVARASGLREDLVERFLPATAPPEALYSGNLVAVARFVKQLTDLGTPAAAIEVAVAELRARPDDAFKVALGSGSHRATFAGKQRRMLISVGATAAVALLAAGIAFAFTAAEDVQTTAAAPEIAATPSSAQVELVTPAVLNVATVPVKRDPVCAQWERASAAYGVKLRAWTKTDPRVPASRWSPKQRAVTMAVIPIMREEASGLRRLADTAKYPLLATVLRGQAMYEDTFADRLVHFVPEDQALWQASSSLSGTAKAICSARK